MEDQATEEVAEAPATELAPQEERTMAMLCHLSSLAGLIIPVPFANIIAPLIFWLINKDKMPFVDEQGTRWIVDYKSTPHDKGDVAKFAQEQVALRHRPQLQKYGELFQALDARPIKLAVYFPLLQQLVVWPFEVD